MHPPTPVTPGGLRGAWEGQGLPPWPRGARAADSIPTETLSPPAGKQGRGRAPNVAALVCGLLGTSLLGARPPPASVYS